MIKLTCSVRWMIHKDIKDVLDIEHTANQDIWTEEELRDCLRQPDHIGLVAEYEDAIIGFCVYRLAPKSIKIFKLAVNPYYKRMGVGTAILNRIKKKMDIAKRKLLTTVVSERNIEGQLFLKACGLSCNKIEKGFFEKDDGYIFQLKIKEEK